MGQLFADLIPAMNFALEPADREVALVAMRQLARIDFDKLPTHNYSVQGQKGGQKSRGGFDPESGRVTAAKVNRLPLKWLNMIFSHLKSANFFSSSVSRPARAFRALSGSFFFRNLI